MGTTFKTFALFLLLLICKQVHAQPLHPEDYRLLWEVSRPGMAKPSYLFGTMHVTDSRVFGFPDSVLLAIQNTQGFALEVDFDSASYRLLEYMYAKHGDEMFDEATWMGRSKSWDGNAGKPDPSELFKLFEREVSHDDETTFLDAFLYRFARENGKVITGLEDIVAQMQLLMEGTGNAVEKDLPDAKGSGRRVRLTEMIDLYAQGDLNRLDALVNHGTTSKFFKEEVVIRRNLKMAERADSLFRIRPTFVGVGAAHLLGDQGVINLLRKQGYQLRPVQATYTGLAKNALEKTYKPRWTTFQREGDGYRLKVPTRPYPIEILDGQVKMYLGMDFPGGLVYCFYAVNLPTEVDQKKMDDIGKAMIKGFGSRNIDAESTKDITYLDLQGKEYVVKKGGEDMRIRVLFGNGKMYMLLFGNSKEVIFSESAEEWFASLEFFEPIRVTRQTPYPVRDPINGFSLNFPGEPDYTTQDKQSFTTGGEDTPYHIYELKDATYRQRMVLLTEDFEDGYSTGTLASRMPDCIDYFAGAPLDPAGPFKPLMTDGIPGMEGSYLGKTGLRYRLRCYLRLNRLYLLGMTLVSDDADSAVVDRVFDSFHFLPLPTPKLRVPVKDTLVFDAVFPGKPNLIAADQVPYPLRNCVDSAWTHLYHDPVTSLNTKITVGRIWKYFSGMDSTILAGGAEYVTADSVKVSKDTRNDAGAWHSRDIVIVNADSTMLEHYRLLIAGDAYLCASIQTTRDAAGEALAAQFFDQFRPTIPPAKDLHRSPKLQLILDAHNATKDTAFAYITVSNLSRYGLQPEEYPLIFSEIRKTADSVPYNLDDHLVELVLATVDSTLQDSIVALYGFLPEDSPHRMELVLYMLQHPWPRANAWATARLRDNPSPLSYCNSYFSWLPYLANDSTGANMERIAYLLDEPEFALRLAGDMADLASYQSVDFSFYDVKLEQILSDAIANFQPASEGEWYSEMHMNQLFMYLMSAQSSNWTTLAHKMMLLPDSYLPGSVYVAMLEQQLRPTKSETRHVFSERHSRSIALPYVLDMQMLSRLPSKFRDPEYIAAVALDVALEEFPSRVELVERRRIEFDKQPCWLYIYKFAYEGDSEWTLGFSGPFPLTGEPANSDFFLAGSDFEAFHPSTYLKKMYAWIREAQ